MPSTQVSVTGSSIGKFWSHWVVEAINKTVRDLRLYQSRSQSLENFKASTWVTWVDTGSSMFSARFVILGKLRVREDEHACWCIFFPNVLCRFRCSRLFSGAFVGSWECSSSEQLSVNVPKLHSRLGNKLRSTTVSNMVQWRWHQRVPGGVGRDDLARGRGTHGVGDRLQTGCMVAWDLLVTPRTVTWTLPNRG